MAKNIKFIPNLIALTTKGNDNDPSSDIENEITETKGQVIILPTF